MFKHRQLTRLTNRGRYNNAFPLFVCMVVASLFLVCAPAHALPAGFQEYYIPGNETQVFRMFQYIQDQESVIPLIVNPLMASVITVVATADHQAVYYDHWEDGYEVDILHPDPEGTTEVYVSLQAGDIVTFTSDGGAGIHQYVPVAPRGVELRYDGGDRLVSTGGPIDVVHALWPRDTTAIGGGWEIYPVGAWATGYSYVVPVGVGDFADCKYVWLEIQAVDDNTVVRIDNGNENEIVSVRLERGETYSSMGYRDGISGTVPSITIHSGTTVLANKPIQGGLATGGPGTFQTRFYTLVPDTVWGDEYVAPIPRTTSANNAEVYLFNPDGRDHTVTAYDTAIPSGAAFTLTAAVPLSYSQVVGQSVPAFSALRLRSDAPLWAVVSADAARPDYDWGFSLIPTRFATRDYYISWAPGTQDRTANGSPVWVTPLSDNTTFNVDYGAPTVDGVADLSFVQDSLQTSRIFDPDNDNTGMRIWADKPFVIIWGEDPLTAAPGTNYLDLGYSVLPLHPDWLETVLTLRKTSDVQALPPADDTVAFTLRALASNAPVTNVDITDTLPVSWTYVAHSAIVTYPNGTAEQREPLIIGDRTLVWDLSSSLNTNQSVEIRYLAQFTSTFDDLGDTRYDNLESGDYNGGPGWSNPWTEHESGGCGGNCVSITDQNAPHSGDYHLVVRETGAISRTADLTGFRQPTLRLWRRLNDLESGDAFHLRLYDGAAWSTPLTLTRINDQGIYAAEQFDLTPYRSSSFALELRGSSDSALDYLYLDDVEIFDAAAIQENTAEATGTYQGHLFSSQDKAVVVLSPFVLRQSADKAAVVGGDTLLYTFAYTNTSHALTMTHVLVRSILPSNTFSPTASPGVTYLPSAHTMVWGRSPTMTLLPDESGTFTVSVTVDPWGSNGQILRSECTIDSDQTVETAGNPVETTIHAPEISLFKNGPSSANAGQTITYTVEYANSGPVTATGAIITDVIPVSTTYQAGSLAIDTGSGYTDTTGFTGDAISVRPGRVSGQIAPGEMGSIRFAVRISPTVSAGEDIVSYAVLLRDYARPQGSTLLLTSVSDLTLEQTSNRSVVGPGANVAYTMTLGSSGGLPQAHVYVRNAIPDHTHYLSGTVIVPPGFVISYSIDHGETWTYTVPVTPALVTDLRWYTPTINRADSFVLGCQVRVEDPLGGGGIVVVNRAQVASVQTPSLYSNEVHIRTVDLVLDKAANSVSTDSSQRITYTITAGNDGSTDAFGAVITDRIPAGTTLVPGSVTYGGENDGQVITWTVDLLTRAAGPTMRFAVAPIPGLAFGQPITNMAHIHHVHDADQSDPVVVPNAVRSPAFALTKQSSGSWTRRVKLTFTNTEQTEDLVNFPVLVVLDSSRISYTQIQTAGQDIRFVDPDGAVLAHEIERWDASGTSYVWVEVPQIDGLSDDDYIWMYYGNPAAPDGQSPEDVWDASYSGVWHLAETVVDEQTDGTHFDSTSNGNDGQQNNNDDAPGWIADGQSFDGTGDYIQITGLLGTPADISISAWANLDSADTDGAEVLSLGDYASLRLDDTAQGTGGFFYDGAGWFFTPYTQNYAGAGWHHFVYTFDDVDNSQKVYVDGVQRASTSYVASIAYTGLGSDTFMGTHGDAKGGFDFNGIIDEVRVSHVARSADWIKAQYATMTDAFIAFGGEENLIPLPGSVIIGTPFTYTLTITNTGMSTATNVVVTDTLPAGAHYISGGSFISDRDTVSWTIPMILDGDSAQATFVVSTCRESLLNAQYRVVTSTQQIASLPGPPLLTLLTPPTVEADFYYTPITVAMGNAVYFTATGTTNGSPIVDWGWDLGDGQTANGSTINHVYPSPGAFTVTLTLTDTCAYVDTVTQTVLVNPLDLTVAKRAAPSVVRAGERLTYTIAVANGGPGYASGVLVSDTLPVGAAFVSATLPHIGPVNGVVTWSLGVLDMGITRSVTVVVRVDSAAPSGAVVTNVARMSSSQGITGTDVVTTLVETSADLAVGKSVSPEWVGAGGLLTYTLIYSNSGPSDAQDVVITDTLPMSVTYGGLVSATPPLFGPTPDGRVWVWYTPTLPAGVSGVIVFTVTVDADAGGVLTNSATIAGVTPDPSLGDNGDEAAASVVPSADFSSATYSVVEDDGFATITVTLDAAHSSPVDVDYQTAAGGSATAGDDYTVVSGTLSFPPFSIIQTFTVPITSDVFDEPDETVILTLAGTVSATVGVLNNPATLTILDDDDPPVVGFGASAYTVDEPDGSAVITVALDTASGFTVTVDYATGDGTATVGSDYLTATGTLTCAPGVAAQAFTVTITDDVTDEDDETITLTLSSPNYATLGGPNPVSLTILDDDPAPALSINDVDVIEGNSGAVDAVFTVTLSSASGRTVGVGYATADGTAIAPADYTSIPTQSLSFVPGMTSRCITVTVHGDTLVEDDESFWVNLFDPTLATIADGQGRGMILDDDDLPTADFVASTYVVGEGDGAAVVTVTLSYPSSFSVTVDYATSDGTAVSGDDYVAVAGTLSWPPFSTAQTFTVPIISDQTDEPDETLVLTLTGATGAAVGDVHNPATLMILDDDDWPTADFVASTYVVDESDGVAAITVTLSHPSSFSVTVDYQTVAGGTATSGDDYVAVSGTLSFLPLETTRTFTVSILHDLILEPDETVVLTLTGAISATIGNVYNPATLTILDDDAPALLYGTVFLDYNGSGVQDVGEPGLSGVLVTLDEAITTTTGLDGGYTFSTMVAGVHTVVETDPSVFVNTFERSSLAPTDPYNYISTTPNSVNVDVILGRTYRVDFGDARTNFGFASIHGIVFRDVDGDGIQDATEPGISNVLVALDASLPTAITTSTDLNGSYTFSSTVTGVYVVSVTEPAGYFATTPQEVHVNVTLGNAYRVDFGNAPAVSGFATVYGVVFSDENSNGMYDVNEMGLSNVTITLDGNEIIATGLYGNYTFSVTLAGGHVVTATDWSNYVSTTPNEVIVDVILGHGYRVDFGDMEVTTCAPDRYEPDDTAAQAQVFVISTIQAHQFCDDATDWIRFAANAGSVYTITTYSWGRRADTILALWGSDSQTQTLAYSDNYTGTTDGSSRIVWNASVSDEYYVRITNQNALTGQRTDYDLRIQSSDSSIIYLSIVMRNF